MGVDFGKLQRIEYQSLSELRGETVVVDAYNLIFRYCASFRDPHGHPLRNDQGEIVSHLFGFVQKFITYHQLGLHPLIVFDGRNKQGKEAMLDLRSKLRMKNLEAMEQALSLGDYDKAERHTRRHIEITPYVISSTKCLAEIFGYPTIDAPGDAEFEGVALCQKFGLYGIETTDRDALVLGSRRIITRLPSTKHPECFEYLSLSSFMEDNKLERYDQLVDFALLVGTDFNLHGAHGFGPIRALQLVRSADYEAQLRHLIPEYQMLRELFHNNHTTIEQLPEPSTPRLGSLAEFLRAHGFSRHQTLTTITEIQRIRMQKKPIFNIEEIFSKRSADP